MIYQEDLDHAPWQFIRQGLPPEEAATPQADTANWERISLPHSAAIEKEACSKENHYFGISWYRLPLFVKEEWKEKVLHLEIDGAMQTIDIYINGNYSFTHFGGYQRFLVPLNGMVEFGKENLIALRLNNAPSNNTPPGKPLQELDFCYFSGLYRSVRLTVSERVHITDCQEVSIQAGGGIFLQTLSATEKKALLSCKVHAMHSIFAGEVWNLPQRAEEPYFSTLSISMRTPEGKELPLGEKLSANIRPNMDHTFETTLEIEDPLLWSPETPHLYTFIFTLTSFDGKVDQKKERFGIRTFSFDREEGWKINGKKYTIIGTNRHQDFPHIGNAAPATMQRRDAMIIKKGGYNLVRMAHYPQHTAFMDACDELGICLMAPIAGWQYVHYNSTFVENTLRDCRELIRRERNRPSIMLWEVSLNETYPNSWLQEEMHRTAHREYPGKQCYTCGDVYGLYEGWDVLFNRTKLLDQTKPVIVREYGDWAFGGGKSTSRRSREDGEYELLRQTWNYQWSMNRMYTEPGYIGGCTWCMFDYNTGFQPFHCECGDCDNFRYPKYKYYFYRSQGAGEPMVFLATGREYKEKTIVFSNCEEVELFLNGRSIAKQKCDKGSNTSYHLTGNPNWETVLRPWELDGVAVEIFNGGNCENLPHPPFTFTGLPEEEGEWKAVGYIDGKKAAEHTIYTAGKAVKWAIQIREEGVPLEKDDLVFADALLLDEKDSIVSNNETKAEFTAGKGASIIGNTSKPLRAGVASFLLHITDPTSFTLEAKGGSFAPAQYIRK